MIDAFDGPVTDNIQVERVPIKEELEGRRSIDKFFQKHVTKNYRLRFNIMRLIKIFYFLSSMKMIKRQFKKILLTIVPELKYLSEEQISHHLKEIARIFPVYNE